MQNDPNYVPLIYHPPPFLENKYPIIIHLRVRFMASIKLARDFLWYSREFHCREKIDRVTSCTRRSRQRPHPAAARQTPAPPPTTTVNPRSTRPSP